MILKVIKPGIIFGTFKIQLEKLNGCKGLPKSQGDLERVLVLCKE